MLGESANAGGPFAFTFTLCLTPGAYTAFQPSPFLITQTTTSHSACRIPLVVRLR
jgi:hypothetical protein